MKKESNLLIGKGHRGLSHCLRGFLVMFFILGVCNLTVHADNDQQVKISGTVKDRTGEPLPGVNILIKGTTLGTITDIDGGYSINIPNEKAVLRFTLVGFEAKEVAVKGKRTIDVTMGEDTQLIDEVVVVGYGTQKKVSLTGAINSVGNDEIRTATTSNVQNMLTGKLPGVRIQQQTGEPGDYSSSMDIRGLGTPLIVIDGVTRDMAAFQRLEANEIESVSVLKDASAAIYGMRAANGVVLVTTRKGKSGKTEFEYTGSFGFQNPSGLPDVLNAYQYAELVRESDLNMRGDINHTFTKEDVERFREQGATDWYDLAMKKFVPQTHHNVTASGSTDRSEYFVSFGYYSENGVWKTGDLNYKRFNIRSNLGFKITDNLKANLWISGMSDEKNQPYNDTWSLFKSIWMLRPTETPYANNNENYMQDVNYGLNPLAILDKDVSGYKKYMNKTFNSTFSLTYDAPFLKGLSAKFLYAYDYKTRQDKEFQKKYTLYNYTVGEGNTEIYEPKDWQSPSSLRRRNKEGMQSQMQVSLNYEKTFNKDHNLKILALYEQNTRKEDNFYAKRLLELDAVDELFPGGKDEQEGNSDTAYPFDSNENAGKIYKITNMAWVGRINYDYKSKYIAEFSCRYDGTSLYAKGHRWGFFPAVSAGYRISEENFIKETEALSFITNLKLRGSYGEMGDDSSAGYQFLAGYNYPGPSYVYGANSSTGLGFRDLPNPLITWYTSKTLNIGADIDLWNGLLTTSVDFFWRNRTGLIAQRRGEVPATLGAGLPSENLNEDKNKGFEIVLGHRNRINDFNYSVSLNFALTRRMWGNLMEGDAANSYDRWRNKYSNRYADMGWTLGSAGNGQFTSMEDIWNSPIQDGLGGSTQLPGDWKYEDWNGDGIIDGNDMYPNTFEHTNSSGNPKITYGATLSADWKGFDINLLIQGGGGFNVIYFEQLQYPLCFGGNGLAHFYDRYHQDENGNWIPGKWPTTRDPGSFGTNYARAKQTTYNANYVRLKSVELGYTIPASFTRKFKVERLRVFADAYNLFTISSLDFVDPEHPESNYGYLYPIMRSFNFGLNLTF